MKAMFADLTGTGPSGHSSTARRAIGRQRVHTLCDAIQVAIYIDDRATIDALMGELALATADEERAN